MSQKLMLVKYVLEDEIPIDESSENLQSAYIPNELVDWMMKEKWSSEIEFKESEGGVANIPVTVIDDSKVDCMKSILFYVETKLVRCIKEANSHISDDIQILKELENDFTVLHIWLNVHEILKEKAEKYPNNHNVKLVVG